jgi:hypothetical protein
VPFDAFPLDIPSATGEGSAVKIPQAPSPVPQLSGCVKVRQEPQQSGSTPAHDTCLALYQICAREGDRSTRRESHPSSDKSPSDAGSQSIAGALSSSILLLIVSGYVPMSMLNHRIDIFVIFKFVAPLHTYYIFGPASSISMTVIGPLWAFTLAQPSIKETDRMKRALRSIKLITVTFLVVGAFCAGYALPTSAQLTCERLQPSCTYNVDSCTYRYPRCNCGLYCCYWEAGPCVNNPLDYAASQICGGLCPDIGCPIG